LLNFGKNNKIKQFQIYKLDNWFFRGSLTVGGATNMVKVLDEVNISISQNPRLGWGDKFAIFRTDSSVKPFIRQEEKNIQLKAIAEGSELEFKHDKHWYGVDTWRNVGYGFWQHACLTQMIKS